MFFSFVARDFAVLLAWFGRDGGVVGRALVATFVFAWVGERGERGLAGGERRASVVLRSQAAGAGVGAVAVGVRRRAFLAGTSALARVVDGWCKAAVFWSLIGV